MDSSYKYVTSVGWLGTRGVNEISQYSPCILTLNKQAWLILCTLSATLADNLNIPAADMLLQIHRVCAIRKYFWSTVYIRIYKDTMLNNHLNT